MCTPLKRLGYEKRQSARCAFVAFFSATNWRHANLAVCFIVPPIRHIQPERYAKWCFEENLRKTILE
jgi:hypothetical protein